MSPHSKFFCDKLGVVGDALPPLPYLGSQSPTPSQRNKQFPIAQLGALSGGVRRPRSQNVLAVCPRATFLPLAHAAGVLHLEIARTV